MVHNPRCHSNRRQNILMLVVALISLLSIDTTEASRKKKLVCYYASWSHYREGLARYDINDIPVELCSHVIYAFAILDGHSLTLKEQDSYGDLQNYRRFIRLKQRNPHVKLLLGLGGWHDSRTDKYSRLVSSPRNRGAFVRHAVEFLQSYGFDGLDLKWEYPAYRGPGADKEGFRLWVKDLKEAFDSQDLILSATVSGHVGIIDRGYDVAAISRDLDQIHLMAYDYHGFWERKVAHHAPLYPVPEELPELSVDYAVRHWLKGGTPPGKLILGVPFYGRSWTLAGTDANTGAEASERGRPGPLLKVPGTSAYYEVCLAHSRYKWPKITSNGGTFLTLYDQWISYDDVDAVRSKTEYALRMSLGGLMVWDISMDDFKNLCGNGFNPLLSTIARTIQDKTSGSQFPSSPILHNVTRPSRVKPSHPIVDRSTRTSRPTTISGSFNSFPSFGVTHISPEYELSSTVTFTSLTNTIFSSSVQIPQIPEATLQPPVQQTQSILLQGHPSSDDQTYHTEAIQPFIIKTTAKPIHQKVISVTDTSLSARLPDLSTTTALHVLIQSETQAFVQRSQTSSTLSTSLVLPSSSQSTRLFNRFAPPSSGHQRITQATPRPASPTRFLKVTKSLLTVRPIFPVFGTLTSVREAQTVSPNLFLHSKLTTSVFRPTPIFSAHQKMTKSSQRPTPPIQSLKITRSHLIVRPVFSTTRISTDVLRPQKVMQSRSQALFSSSQLAKPVLQPSLLLSAHQKPSQPTQRLTSLAQPFKVTQNQANNQPISLVTETLTFVPKPLEVTLKPPTFSTSQSSKSILRITPLSPAHIVPQPTWRPIPLTQSLKVTRTRTIVRPVLPVTKVPSFTHHLKEVMLQPQSSALLSQDRPTASVLRLTPPSSVNLRSSTHTQSPTPPARPLRVTRTRTIVRSVLPVIKTSPFTPNLEEMTHHPTISTLFSPDQPTGSVLSPTPPSSVNLRSSTLTQSPTPPARPLTAYIVRMNTTECKLVGYTSDLTSCSHFYRCDNNRAFRFECPVQLQWRQDLLVCDWAQRKPCKDSRSLNFSERDDSHYPTDQKTVFDEATGGIGYFSHYI